MSNLVDPISQEQQQRVMRQMYLLMGKQVQSYHKYNHLGDNSSIPVELAQELMESILYTANAAGGLFANTDADETLRLGQKMLANRCQTEKSMLELVSATAPRWQTECRWEAQAYLRQYLESYDYQHLAHRGPDGLFYPILISQPDGIQGIDICIFYLEIMRIENQIMAAVPENALEQFWNHLPIAALNQCEYLLINCMGKALLEAGNDSLVLEAEEKGRLVKILKNASVEDLRAAAKRLCHWLDIKEEAATAYVEAAVFPISLWFGGGIDSRNADNLFL